MPHFQSIFFILITLLLFPAGNAIGMTRTLQEDPALVVVAFGTTTRARVTYDFFGEQLLKELPDKYKDIEVRWAFTSEIVREIANKKFARQGNVRRFKSLSQVLADLENEGFRKVVIQSLHIFPGQEFEDMQKEIKAFRDIGLRIEYGGTLLHEWKETFEVIQALQTEFLGSAEGENILVAHGTPETSSPATGVYLGLDRHLDHTYENVGIAGVSGVLTRDQAFAALKKSGHKKVRLIPFMYVAGDHIMNDIMADKPDKDGELSWALQLRRDGFEVEGVTIVYGRERLHKGLGFNPAINHFFIEKINHNLEKITRY